MTQKLISREKVLDEVKKAISEGIDIDRATVKHDSSLIRDLGAESLDFLDINYRIEQAFGIKMARHSVLEHIEEMFGEESAIDADGKLTEKAVKIMSLRFNNSEGALKPGMDMDELPAMVTVDSIVDAVMSLLDTLPEKCGECGAAGWSVQDESRIHCGSCGESAAFTNGDELIDIWLKQVQDKEKIF